MSVQEETVVRLRIDDSARKRIQQAGGEFTLEARAKTGCMIRIELEPRLGRPREPDQFELLSVGELRVYARGLFERPDGTLRPTKGVLPGRVRIRERDGGLVAEAG